MTDVIAISGLPGVGKTAVAAGVASRVGAVHLSIDSIEEALLCPGLEAGWKVGVAAYETARAAAEQNLELGKTVVVDAVNDSDEARGTWRRAAADQGARLQFVHLTCSDSAEHRKRLEGRSRSFTRVPEPTWSDVAERTRQYPPWVDECAAIDTAGIAVDVVVNRVVARCGPLAASPT